MLENEEIERRKHQVIDDKTLRVKVRELVRRGWHGDVIYKYLDSLKYSVRREKVRTLCEHYERRRKKLEDMFFRKQKKTKKSVAHPTDLTPFFQKRLDLRRKKRDKTKGKKKEKKTSFPILPGTFTEGRDLPERPDLVPVGGTLTRLTDLTGPERQSLEISSYI